MKITLARLGAVAAAAVAALVPASADAAGEGCTRYVNVYSVNVPGFVDCSIASTGAFLGRVGDCTAGYQPLQPPFGSQVGPQTTAYADCLV